MNLLPPRVIGPVSECSKAIRVQGQFPGATVEVIDRLSGDVIAADTATSSDVHLHISGTLAPGQELVALQALGGDSSDVGAEPVQVQAKPDPIGPGVFVEPVFQCAQCVWIDGLVPGADVEVVQGGAVMGTGESRQGYARINFSGPLGAGPVRVEHEACGDRGESFEADGVAPFAGDRQGRVLPPPIVESPLQECRNRVTISGVVPGAIVELERSMGPNGASCFDRPSLWWGMNPALSETETIRARQSFRECEKYSDWSSPPEVVGPVEPVPPPSVVGPLCAGSTSVRLCGLLAGATVRLIIVAGGHHGTEGGESFEFVAPEDGCFDVMLAEPGLPADSMVCATQELCMRESVQSSAVRVADTPANLPKPEVADPLFACSIVVPVSNLAPGARLYVVADGIGVIGEAHVTATELDVTVRPALQAGWKVSAYQVGCGLTSDPADSVEVQDAPEELPPPRVIEPVHSCDTAVSVADVVPGAAVDIYVNDEWVGRSMVGTDEGEVGIDLGPLEVGDQINARQTICGLSSDFGDPVEVSRFDGEWEILRNGDGDIIEDKSAILAVHAALLPTGKILIFAGDQYTNDGQPVDNSVLMDAGPPWSVQALTGIPGGMNLFCSGHAMLADGSIITGGGTESRPPPAVPDMVVPHIDHWLGLRGSMRFRQGPGGVWTWEQQGDLVTARPADVRAGFDAAESGGRWYPTLATLPDGRVLAIGGHPLDGDVRHTNTSLELYDPAAGTWSIVGTADYPNIPGRNQAVARSRHSEYPGVHVLPEGTVFVASAMEDGDVWKWTPGDDALDWCRVANTPSGYTGNPQPVTSVLLPLRHERDFHAEVLLCGGNIAYTIAPEGSCPAGTNNLGRSWSATAGPSLGTRRNYPLSTLLPTGEVLVSGGAATQADDSTGVLRPEIYDPADGSWRLIEEEATRVRNYHSTALLLPDGSVWHSGSNRDCAPGYDTQDRTVEIFKPWYFCWDRPRLDMVTDRVCHGETFSLRTPDAADIAEVVLVRVSSFTHAFNPDQRLVGLRFTRDQEDAALLHATPPATPGIAVVGYYLCFVLDRNRVPSHSQFLQVCPAGGSGGSDDDSSRSGLTGDLFDLMKDLVDRDPFDESNLRQRLIGLLLETGDNDD